MNQTLAKFNIRLEAGSEHHCSVMADIRAALCDGVSAIMLELYGHGGLTPDMSLAYHDLFLSARKSLAELEIYTLSHSNFIVAGDWLLWLQGKPRDIRPSAWLYFPSIDVLREELEREGEAGNLQIAKLRDHFHLWSYEKCVAILDEYIPAESWCDRKISYAEVNEFGLLDEEKLDSQIEDGRKNWRKNLAKQRKSIIKAERSAQAGKMIQTELDFSQDSSERPL